MKQSNNLLKHSYRLSIAGSLFSLLESLFMVIPIYWISTLVFSLDNINSAENIHSLVSAIGLILITLSKIGLSISGLILELKLRKQYRFNKAKFNNSKLVLTLAIINSILPIIVATSLFLGLEINFLFYIDIAISILLISSAILLFICYSKLKKQNKQ